MFLKVGDKVFLTLTSKVLPVKKLFINIRMWPLKFHFWSVERTLCFHTVLFPFMIPVISRFFLVHIGMNFC